MFMHPKFTQNAEWIRSTASEGYGDCVEVAFVTIVLMRDSKEPDGPSLCFSGSEWEAFLIGANRGEVDLP